jgi:hypothetical protein
MPASPLSDSENGQMSRIKFPSYGFNREYQRVPASHRTRLPAEGCPRSNLIVFIYKKASFPGKLAFLYKLRIEPLFLSDFFHFVQFFLRSFDNFFQTAFEVFVFRFFV